MAEETPNKVGRPTVMTPEKRAEIIGALRVCGSRTAAYNGACVSRGAFYDCLNGDTEFSEAVLIAEAEAENFAMKSVVGAMREGDWRAAQWWLSVRRHKDYAPNLELRALQDTVKELAATVAKLQSKKTNGDGRG